MTVEAIMLGIQGKKPKLDPSRLHLLTRLTAHNEGGWYPEKFHGVSFLVDNVEDLT